MLSRAEQLLVVVGSWEFFRKHAVRATAGQTEHLPRLERNLREAFELEKAVMLDTSFDRCFAWRDES
jgi:7-keto-8-aminopelargonate synthetase-like enzyme